MNTFKSVVYLLLIIFMSCSTDETANCIGCGELLSVTNNVSLDGNFEYAINSEGQATYIWYCSIPLACTLSDAEVFFLMSVYDDKLTIPIDVKMTTIPGSGTINTVDLMKLESAFAGQSDYYFDEDVEFYRPFGECSSGFTARVQIRFNHQGSRHDNDKYLEELIVPSSLSDFSVITYKYLGG